MLRLQGLRLRGDPQRRDVLVRFAGHSGSMRIQYLRSDAAAVRWAYDHGSPGNAYGSTNRFRTPSHLSHGDVDALSTCLPMPRNP